MVMSDGVIHPGLNVHTIAVHRDVKKEKKIVCLHCKLFALYF